MFKFLNSLLLILTGMTAVIYSQDIESFSAAQALSRQSGKPILLEFVRSD